MIKEYEENYNFGYIECSNPDCGCSNLNFYGSYERNVLGNGELRIRIKRVQCTKCKATHALIPSFIIPYYQTEASYINMVLYMVVVRKKRKQYLEHILNISRQKIRQWEKRFLQHYSYLITTFKTDNKEDIFEMLRQSKLLKKYRVENKIRYLQIVPT